MTEDEAKKLFCPFMGECKTGQCMLWKWDIVCKAGTTYIDADLECSDTEGECSLR